MQCFLQKGVDLIAKVEIGLEGMFTLIDQNFDECEPFFQTQEVLR